jgi:phage gp46-like protein
MPAGFFYAGAGFAGADPVAAPSTPAVVLQTSNAALYDLATRSVPRDENGLVKRVHWVDQAVALALGVSLGALPSSPTIGHRLRQIKRAAGPKLATEAEDAVNEALADLLDRGDIAIITISVTTSVRSQIIVAVTYVNLRTNPKFAANLSVAF